MRASRRGNESGGRLSAAETFDVARRLRNSVTRSEALLWGALRRRQAGGYRFRRQHPIFGFVVDFYCPELKLAIEVDGDVHLDAEVASRDEERQQILESLGLWFIRIAGHDIETDLHATIRQIHGSIAARQQTTGAESPPTASQAHRAIVPSPAARGKGQEG